MWFHLKLFLNFAIKCSENEKCKNYKEKKYEQKKNINRAHWKTSLRLTEKVGFSLEKQWQLQKKKKKLSTHWSTFSEAHYEPMH